jgi:hypothetical protein
VFSGGGRVKSSRCLVKTVQFGVADPFKVGRLGSMRAAGKSGAKRSENLNGRFVFQSKIISPAGLEECGIALPAIRKENQILFIFCNSPVILPISHKGIAKVHLDVACQHNGLIGSCEVYLENEAQEKGC